jgi:small-conductance mechanosensitive channel
MAFKGVSLFLGVIFSLGSSSFIANTIAGISMTYRGAFKQGDLVKIGEIIGAVDDVKLMTTRIRTAKNEIAVVPNSNILNTSLINYSALARSHGLALHTAVSIGYDVPWRDVEAMLLLAVERTEGLKTEPKPFVLHSSFGDFAAKYEVNAYCDDPLRMMSLYSALHANIQDVFNEHGVQIMSPVYTQLLPALPADLPTPAPGVHPA